MIRREPKLVHIALAWVVAAAVVVAPLAVTPAFAQNQLEQARAHYKRGEAKFKARDYHGAIREFQAADRLAPHSLNEYNIALSYDRLNNKRQAVVHYESYLRRAPTARNQAAVRQKVRQLREAIRVEEAKRVEADRKAEEARKKAEADRKAEEARKAAEAAKKGGNDSRLNDEVAKRKAEEAARARLEAQRQAEARRKAEEARRRAEAARKAPTPTPSTGDPQLDRVAAIDIAAIRDSRNLRGAGTPPPVAGKTNEPSPSSVAMGADRPKKKKKPAYKQWWFWVVMGVGAVILIDIASSDSNNRAAPASGMTLFRF